MTNVPTTHLADESGESRDTRALQTQYHALIGSQQLNWPTQYRMLEELGAGSQGVVYLGDRVGAHGFSTRVAIKLFAPGAYASGTSYRQHMEYIASIAARVAAIQQDHLLDVLNFVEFNGIQAMTMEWVDGFDLERLLRPATLEETRVLVEPERWEYINDVLVTHGPDRLRLKPGVAIAVLRECLAGLAALHREGIVHGDVKPGNLMLKRTGNAKVVDIGSAFDWRNPPRHRTWTPRYSAIETLRDSIYTRSSEIAGLGYVLLEMLSGRHLFKGCSGAEALIERKHMLHNDVKSVLPKDVARNDLLLKLIRGMIDPEPPKRFENAEAVDLADDGAAHFQRQLVNAGLASEYETDMRQWLDRLP